MSVGLRRTTGRTGRFGSVAFAARLFGVTARICVPERSDPVKLPAMRGLGADVVVAESSCSTCSPEVFARRRPGG